VIGKLIVQALAVLFWDSSLMREIKIFRLHLDEKYNRHVPALLAVSSLACGPEKLGRLERRLYD
jgi:hypothetical protein